MIKKISKIFFLLILILIPFTAMKAAGTKTGETVYVPKEEIISGNLYVAGQSVTIDGTVSGDLIAAAQVITVNGRIEGDIIAVSQDITVNGEIGGNIRVAGNALTINGAVARNINAFGANIVLGDNARIGWDAYLVGSNISVRGIVDGSLSGHAGQALITGKIGKNIDLKLNGDTNQKLTIGNGAIINGDITYTSKQAAAVSPGASIAGNINQITPEIKTTNLFWPWLWNRLFAIFAALVVGLVLTTVGKKNLRKINALIEEKPGRALIPGLLIFFVIPPAALVLMITIIGIPLALILSAIWLIAIYFAKIITAILLGNILLNKLVKKESWSLTWSLVPGVIVCWLLFSIPFVGWLFGLVAVWIGLGGLWFHISGKSGNA